MEKMSTVLAVILTLTLLQGSIPQCWPNLPLWLEVEVTVECFLLLDGSQLSSSGITKKLVLHIRLTTLVMIWTQVYPSYISNLYLRLLISGQTDEYTGEILGSCRTTEFSDGLFQFVMHHHGFDGWCMHSVSLTFNTGEVLDCVADVELDNDQGYRCPGHN